MAIEGVHISNFRVRYQNADASDVYASVHSGITSASARSVDIDYCRFNAVGIYSNVHSIDIELMSQHQVLIF